MDFKQLNVLVVSGGSFQGLTVIKGLRYSETVRIIIADSSRENIGKYFTDKFYLVDEIKERDSFIRSLLDICEKEDIHFILPSTDRELVTLSDNIHLFNERNIHVAVSDPDILDVLRNKILLYTFLSQNKFPVLPRLDISDENLNFPILGKPLYSWGGRGIIAITSKGELLNHDLPDLKANYVWQRCLKDFDEYSIDCAIDPEGKISELVVRIRLKTFGGFAVIAANVNEPIIEKMVDSFLRLITPLGARGILNMQVMREGHDYYISDVNPRIGTSAVFGYEQGINLPLFFCSPGRPEVYPPELLSRNRNKKYKMVRYLEEIWIQMNDSDKVKAVVFDLDDTLINQKIWIADKLEILWSKFRDTLPGKEKFLSRAVQIVEEGNRSRVFDALSHEFRFPDGLKERLIETYRQIQPENCPLFPDVLPTLTGLRENGFRLALLTDNPPETQRQKIETCNFETLFNTILYSRDINLEKPDTTVFKEISKRLDIPEQYLVMVGDNLYKDVIGSLDSGYRTAYWLSREGTFFNFEQKILKRLFKAQYDFIKIRDLRYLLWSLLPEGTGG
jgi:FMN phosphatase YigB (HAD superfamily)